MRSGGIGINLQAVSSSLPLDNIISVANAAALPGGGTTVGRILYYTQDTKSWYFWDGGAWVLILDDADHAALVQVIADLAAHIADGTDAHDASAISSVPAGNLAATDVQGALNELQSNIDALQTEQDNDETDLANHLADAADAHDASAISVVPTGNLAADDVQEALQELQGDVDTLRTDVTELQTHRMVVVANSAQANGATFTPANNRRQIQQISGSGGAATLTDLGITNALDGDELTLLGTDNSNTVTIVSATNTVMNGSCTLAANDMIEFIFVGTKWIERSRSA